MRGWKKVKRKIGRREDIAKNKQYWKMKTRRRCCVEEKTDMLLLFLKSFGWDETASLRRRSVFEVYPHPPRAKRLDDLPTPQKIPGTMSSSYLSALHRRPLTNLARKQSSRSGITKKHARPLQRFWSRGSMLCYAMLCYAMLCYAMLHHRGTHLYSFFPFDWKKPEK